MKVRDPLYGEFEIPGFLRPFVLAPEFRRLSEVRLLNINSPTLSALADVSRYTHTLGVIHLALQNPMMGLDARDVEAFLVSIVLHDAGTPPFAHLFEYHLKERFAWSHEAVVDELLTGSHHPDNIVHQFYRGQRISVRSLCEKAGIDFERLRRFIRKEHPFSSMIFGSIDFDNLDNVARMATMMGIVFDQRAVLTLSKNLSVNSSGALLLSQGLAPQVEEWARARRHCYDVLVYDGPTVAGQAVLSRAIALGLELGVLNEHDWFYTDSDFIRVLLQDSHTKDPVQRLLMSRLPTLCLLAKVEGPSEVPWNLGRREIESLVEEFARDELPKAGQVVAYSFRDKGAFEKRLTFVDPESGSQWSTGKTSDSLVLYCFATNLSTNVDPRAIGTQFLQWARKRHQ